ncbi:hypothetical protein L195_g061663, partial [Trifolium pratense]
MDSHFAGSLWELVREWVDISPVDSTTLHDHFAQFTASCRCISSAAVLSAASLTRLCLG